MLPTFRVGNSLINRKIDTATGRHYHWEWYEDHRIYMWCEEEEEKIKKTEACGCASILLCSACQYTILCM